MGSLVPLHDVRSDLPLGELPHAAAKLLLLFGVAIFLASMKTYVELRLKLPVPQGQAPREGGSAERAAGRWAVTAWRSPLSSPATCWPPWP